MKAIMKKIGIFILVVIAIYAIGIVGQADYEYETIEARAYEARTNQY